jgi:preprotein translocase subunit Sss1
MLLAASTLAETYASLRDAGESSHVLIKLTAYLTGYDSLSSCYRVLEMAQKPQRNRYFSGSQVSADGFRALSCVNPQEEAEMRKAASGGSTASMVGWVYGEN